MKNLVIGFLILIAIIVALCTFVWAMIEITIGAIILGVFVLAILIAWGFWKASTDDQMDGLSREALIELAWYKMPFGKYKGQFLSELPEPYYVWFRQKGWPNGKLGRLLQSVHELKVNGLEFILRDVRKTTRPN